jgi:phosphate transport system protein
MTKRFHKEIENIKKMILTLGSKVVDRVQIVTQAIESCDVETASKVINMDHEIDEAEVEIEEECLKVLALYQPVAVDLRFLVAVIKINNDLERIGDQAVNIAQRIMTMSKDKKNGEKFFFDYSRMIEKVNYMLNQSLESLVNMDVDMAIEVCQMDDIVDNIKSEAYRSIKSTMKENPNQLSYLINLFLISRHLERLADHCTNIAEEVIYMIEGEIVRHGPKK